MMQAAQVRSPITQGTRASASTPAVRAAVQRGETPSPPSMAGSLYAPHAAVSAPPSKETKPQPATPRVQPKLRVGPPDDQFEQQADRFADTAVQRKPACDCGSGCPKCQGSSKAPVQRLPAGQMPEASPELSEQMMAPLGGGQPLPPTLRSEFEGQLGSDLGGVRIHSGPRAAEAAQSIDARAFTKGSDIVFDQGQYAPGTADGRRLLAHEVAHVHQQGADTLVRREIGRDEEKRLSLTSPGQITGRARPPAFSLYNFGINQASLKLEHVAFLLELAELIDETNPNVLSVKIVGHASAPGGDVLNEDLSHRRAVEVLTLLSAAGVANLEIDWHGETRPVGDNSSVAGRSRNRRVDIRIALTGPPPIPDETVLPPPEGGDDTWFCLRYPLICLAIGAGAGLFALLVFCLMYPLACLSWIPWPGLPGLPDLPELPDGDDGEPPDKQPLRPGTPLWVRFKEGHGLEAHPQDARYRRAWIQGTTIHAHAYTHNKPAKADAIFELPADATDPIPVPTTVRVLEGGEVRGETQSVIKTGTIVRVFDMPMTGLTGSDAVGQNEYSLEWQWSNNGTTWVPLGTSGKHPLFWLYAAPPAQAPLYTAAVKRATRYAAGLTDAQAVANAVRAGPRIVDGMAYNPADPIDDDPLDVYTLRVGICTDYANLLMLLARSVGLAAHTVMFYGGFRSLGHDIWVALGHPYRGINLIDVSSPHPGFNPPPGSFPDLSPGGWPFNYHAIAQIEGVLQDAALDRGGPPTGQALHQGLQVYFVELAGTLPPATVGELYLERIPRRMHTVDMVFNHYNRYITGADFIPVVPLYVAQNQPSPYYTPVTWLASAYPSLTSVGLRFHEGEGFLVGEPSEPVDLSILAVTRYPPPPASRLMHYHEFSLTISP